MTTSYYEDLPYPYPPPIQERLNKCVSFGITGIIELLPSGRIGKSPHPQASPYSRDLMRKQLLREYEVYQRLSTHDRLVKMIEYSGDGTLVLEYMPLGNLREYLKRHRAVITPSQRVQWCVDAAESVHVVHSHGIIHCDIKPENFLLDSDLRLRLIDFSGSSIDGKPPYVLENTRFFLPRSRDDELPCSVITDLFALGSTFYEIVTGEQPYLYLEDKEVDARYKRQEFPIVDGIPCGEIIKKCWMSDFNSAKSVETTLQGEIRKYNFSSSYLSWFTKHAADIVLATTS